MKLRYNNPQPATRNPQPATRNPQPATRNPQPATRNPQPRRSPHLAHQSNTNSRIAIIGAGPGGLATAEALKEKGYQNITVIEKTKHVGGMSLSRQYPKEATASQHTITYDMGSIQPFGTSKVFAFIKKYGLHLGKGISLNHPAPIRIYCMQEKQYVADFLTYPILGMPLRKLPTLCLDIVKFIPWLYRYRRLAKPGLANTQPLGPVSIPMLEWFNVCRFKLLDRLLRTLFGALNFAVYEATPDHALIHGFKNVFYDLLNRHPRYIRGIFLPVREGYQEIWNRVAKNHQVLCGVNIEKIERTGDEIHLYWDSEKHTFDRLVIACSPDSVAQCIDASPQEKTLLSKVRHSPGWRAAFLAKGLPHDAMYIFTDQMENSAVPPQLYGFIPEGEVEDGVWLYTTMLGFTEKQGVEAVMQHSAELLQQHFGAEVISWVDKAYWSQYNAHFDCEDTKNGMYDLFESLQGLKHTYFVTELLSGPGHSMLIDYAYQLVDKHF